MKLESLAGTRRSCIGTGLIVLDVVCNLIEGRGTVRRFAGGTCGNVLAILSFLGWNSSAVGRIGDDPAGRELLKDLTKWGVGTEWLKVEEGRGTPVIVQENYLDSRWRPRHRFSRVCPLCGTVLPPYRALLALDAAALSSLLPVHSLFFFDRVAPGILELARESRSKGALVVFEPSGIKDERMFLECLRTAHIVKYSRERIQGVHELVVRAKVPIEIETLGAKGLKLRMLRAKSAGPWVEFPAFSTGTLLDAAGSGDWCTAGLLHCLLTKESSIEALVSDDKAIQSAVRFGQALAALNCNFEGSRGLMYASDFREVLAWATATVDGKSITVSPSNLSRSRPTARRNSGTCAACIGKVNMDIHNK